MSWRDRAETIDDKIKTGGSWRDRAEQVGEPAGLPEQENFFPPLETLGRQAKAAVTGFGRGVSSGLLDEAVATRAIKESPLQTLASKVGLRKEPSQFSEQYEAELPKVREEQTALKEEFPATSVISDIAGTIAQPAKGFKQMVAQGAAQGFGRGEGGIEDRLKGAAGGAALGTLGYGAGKVIKAGAEKLLGKEAAGELALKQAIPKMTDVRHVEERGLSLSEIGDELLKTKSLSSTPENTLNSIKGKLKEINISKQLEDLNKYNVKIDGNKILGDIVNKKQDIIDKFPERYSNATDEYLKFLSTKLNKPDVAPKDMKDVIRNLDKQINYNRRMSETTGGAIAGTEFLSDIRRSMENSLREQIAISAPPKVRDAYLKSNKTFELLSAAEDMFENEMYQSKAGGLLPGGSPLTRMFEAIVQPVNILAPTVAYPLGAVRKGLEKTIGEKGINAAGEMLTRGQKMQLLIDQHRNNRLNPRQKLLDKYRNSKEG
jgi:hypothetical protein